MHLRRTTTPRRSRPDRRQRRPSPSRATSSSTTSDSSSGRTGRSTGCSRSRTSPREYGYGQPTGIDLSEQSLAQGRLAGRADQAARRVPESVPVRQLDDRRQPRDGVRPGRDDHHPARAGGRVLAHSRTAGPATRPRSRPGSCRRPARSSSEFTPEGHGPRHPSARRLPADPHRPGRRRSTARIRPGPLTMAFQGFPLSYVPAGRQDRHRERHGRGADGVVRGLRAAARPAVRGLRS